MKKFIFMVMAMVATVSMSAQHVVESKAFDNTYVGVSVGGTVQTPLFNATHDLNKIKPVIGVEIGKDLTTLYGTSIEGKGTINNKGIHTMFDDFSIVWNHKLDLTNAIGGFNPNRSWGVKTVGGLGWGHDNGCVVDNYLVAEVGVEVIYHINDKWAFNMNPTFVWNQAETGLNVNNSEMEFSVGFTYNLGKGFKTCDVDAVVIERDFLNDEVNKLREVVAEQEAEIAKQKQLLNEDFQTIKELNARKMVNNVTVVVPSTVGFEIGKANVLPTSKASLVQLAKFLKENEDMNVTVEGYADAKTGTATINQKLSEQRANAVKEILVANGVAAKRITTVGKGDTVQPFEENALNRAVITIVK